MTVWVIMGNDYPDKIFGNEAEAKAYCISQTTANAKAMARGDERKIYWRSCPFEVQGAAPSANPTAASPTAEAFDAMADVFCAKAIFCDRRTTNDNRPKGLTDEAWNSITKGLAHEASTWREASRNLRAVARGEKELITKT